MKRIFINVSNHRIDTWTKEQLEEATILGNGNIVDIPFPYVHPEMNELQIEDMAIDLIETILNHIDVDNDRVAYIHIMGELGLTYKAVDSLFKIKYEEDIGVELLVIHSTTSRDVHEFKEGNLTKKNVVFKFIQFRSY